MNDNIFVVLGLFEESIFIENCHSDQKCIQWNVRFFKSAINWFATFFWLSFIKAWKDFDRTVRKLKTKSDLKSGWVGSRDFKKMGFWNFLVFAFLLAPSVKRKCDVSCRKWFWSRHFYSIKKGHEVIFPNPMGFFHLKLRFLSSYIIFSFGHFYSITQKSNIWRNGFWSSWP